MNTSVVEFGCMNIWIDEVVPCLRDNSTGEVKETVVFKIESRKYLAQYREDNGWGINWYELPKDVEVYALALRDSNEIQGMIALRNDERSEAVYLHFGCTAPFNNKWEYGHQKYSGVGGHLFAIAADKSFQWGYDGLLYGFAASEPLLKHYIEVFGADYIGIQHEYHFIIDTEASRKLMEVYNYEWH